MVGTIALIHGRVTLIACRYNPIAKYVDTITKPLLVQLVSQDLSNSTLLFLSSIMRILSSSVIFIYYQIPAFHVQLLSIQRCRFT